MAKKTFCNRNCLHYVTDMGKKTYPYDDPLVPSFSSVEDSSTATMGNFSMYCNIKSLVGQDGGTNF